MSQVVVRDDRTPKGRVAVVELSWNDIFECDGVLYRRLDGAQLCERLVPGYSPVLQSFAPGRLVTPRPDIKLTMILDNA